MTIPDSDTTAVSVPAAPGTIPGAAAASFIIANSFTAPTAITLNCQRLDTNAGSTAAYNIKLTVATVDAVSN